MFLAKLFSKNNSCSISGTRYALNKYKNLIKWTENPSIFELGIGDGTNTEKNLLPILPANVDKFVATDKSPEMVEHAKHNETLLSKGMTFQTFDINKYLVPDLVENFDNLFSFYTLHWVQNTDYALRNFWKLLKSGGQLFIVCLAETPNDEPHDKLSKDSKWGKYGNAEWISPYYKYKYANDTYKQKLEDAGFVDVTVKSDVYVHTFNEQEYINLMIAINPSVGRIPPHQTDEYVEEYLNHLKNNKYVTYETDPNGKTVVHCQNNLLTLYARKP